MSVAMYRLRLLSANAALAVGLMPCFLLLNIPTLVWALGTSHLLDHRVGAGPFDPTPSAGALPR